LAALIDRASRLSATGPELVVVVVVGGGVVVPVETVVVVVVDDVVVDEEVVVAAGAPTVPWDEPAAAAVAQSPLTRAKVEIDAVVALRRRGVVMRRSWWARGAMSSLAH
jgi:hypothetical protein